MAGVLLAVVVILASLSSCAGDALAPPVDHSRQHLFYLPGGGQCLKDAERECKQILQVCRPGRDCEIQCSTDHVPHLSHECVRSHPCAQDVEKWCDDHGKATLVECLRSHAHRLSQKCRDMEPCLTHNKVRCPNSAFWVNPQTPMIQRLFPFLPHPETIEQHCECDAGFPCGEHLDHEFCQPCGPGCVRNPICGVGRHWCIVSDHRCTSSTLVPMYPHDCYGPYHGHPGCSASIVVEEAKIFHDEHHFPRTTHETIKQRCEVQNQLAKKGICPKVDLKKVEKKLDKFSGHRLKRCNNLPSISSFVHNFFGSLFHPHGGHHHGHREEAASVAHKLHEQDRAIHQEHETLKHIQEQLSQVEREKQAQAARFHSDTAPGLSGTWLLVVPVCLCALAAVLYQWRTIRRLRS